MRGVFVARFAWAVMLFVAVTACGQPVGRASTPSSPGAAVASPHLDASLSGSDCSNPDHLTRQQQMAMEPAIQPEDLLLIIAESGYGIGDIVAFTPPADWIQGSGEPFIKRIVAQGGDSVVLRDGQVVVNGRDLVEPYVWPGREPFERTEQTGDLSRWVVPPGSVFLLGDHRAASADSRVFGPVPATSIIGRIGWRCAPNAGPVSSAPSPIGVPGSALVQEHRGVRDPADQAARDGERQRQPAHHPPDAGAATRGGHEAE